MSNFLIHREVKITVTVNFKVTIKVILRCCKWLRDNLFNHDGHGMTSFFRPIASVDALVMHMNVSLIESHC